MLVLTRRIGEQIVARATQEDPLLENLAADLTDVAYHVALQHGMGNHWLDMQLDLWRALTEALEKRSHFENGVSLSHDSRLDDE